MSSADRFQGLGAEDDDDLRAVELARGDAVQRPDQRDTLVARQAFRLRSVPRAVEDDAPAGVSAVFPVAEIL